MTHNRDFYQLHRFTDHQYWDWGKIALLYFDQHCLFNYWKALKCILEILKWEFKASRLFSVPASVIFKLYLSMLAVLWHSKTNWACASKATPCIPIFHLYGQQDVQCWNSFKAKLLKALSKTWELQVHKTNTHSQYTINN